MRRSTMIFVAVFAAGIAVGWLVTAVPERTALAQQPPRSAATVEAAQAQPQKEGAEAGIKAITAEYVKAFNAADAKAAAMLWTINGEYDGSEDEPITGREAIEKSLAAYFKTHPKATIEVRIESVRSMGRGLAAVDGVAIMKVPGDTTVHESRYNSLHVLEDGKWLAATVREWVPDPATAVTPKQMEFLIGEWTASGAGGDVKMVYSWDEDKVYIVGKFSLSKDGKVVSKGTQVIGRNPMGGLRSWMFDSSGTTSDGVWVRDENRWINDATGLLPDGSEVSSVNVLIPIGPDAFTWQTTERVIDGVVVAGLPPVKVTRVKK